MASHEFQIADDNEILKRLGMHKCRKQVMRVCVSRDPGSFLCPFSGGWGGVGGGLQICKSASV